MAAQRYEFFFSGIKPYNFMNEYNDSIMFKGFSVRITDNLSVSCLLINLLCKTE